MAILEVNENQKQMLYQILKIQDRKLKSKDKIKNLDVVKSYYGYSNEKALQSLKILNREQIDFIKQRLDVGGTR